LGLPGVEATCVDFRDVGDQDDFQAPGSSHQIAKAPEKLVVCETVDDRELTLE
jgi:hypothetical protein